MMLSNMFKPALARGEIQCIGATTLDEYRQHIEKDGALERRFQKVLVEPTSIDETVQILNNIKDKYGEHHSVTIYAEAIDGVRDHFCALHHGSAPSRQGDRCHGRGGFPRSLKQHQCPR